MVFSGAQYTNENNATRQVLKRIRLNLGIGTPRGQRLGLRGSGRTSIFSDEATGRIKLPRILLQLAAFFPKNRSLVFLIAHSPVPVFGEVAARRIGMFNWFNTTRPLLGKVADQGHPDHGFLRVFFGLAVGLLKKVRGYSKDGTSLAGLDSDMVQPDLAGRLIFDGNYGPVVNRWG